MRKILEWARLRRPRVPVETGIVANPALVAAMAELRNAAVDLHMFEIDSLIARRRLPEATAMIIQILPQLEEAHTQEWMSLTLNLCYALAVSIEARMMIAPDRALPNIIDAIDALRAEEANRGTRLANALRNFAAVQLACEEGDVEAMHRNAMAAYDEAISLYDAANERSQLGQTLINRSEAFRRRPIGDVAENVRLAREDGKRALQLLRGNLAGEARAHSVLGMAALNDEQGAPHLAWADAVAHFESAATLWERCGAHVDLIEEQINLATARAELGRHRGDTDEILAACQLLEAALHSAGSGGHPRLYLRAGTELLVASTILSQTAPPADYTVQQIIGIGEQLLLSHDRLGWPSHGKAHIHGALASFLIGSGSSCKSLDYLDRAAPHVDAAVGFWAHFQQYAKRASLLTDFAMALDTLGEAERAEEAYAKAFALGELQLGQALSLSALSSWSVNLYRATIGRTTLLIRAGKHLEALCELEAILGRSLYPGAGFDHSPALSALERNDRNADQQRAATSAIEELGDAARQNAKPPKPTFDAATLVAQFPAHLILLYPLIGPLSAHILCVGRSDPAAAPWIEAIDWPGSVDAVAAVLAALPIDETDWRDAADALEQALAALGETLGPSLDGLITRRELNAQCELCIVGHGPFAALPWHALVWQAGAQRRYLDELGCVAQVPSLAWLLEERRGRGGNTISIIADPTGDLTGARVERQIVATALRRGSCLSLLGDEATRTAVASAFSTSALIHLASHANFEWRTPMQSTLCLADGDLSIADLIAFEGASPDLVVLSSCSSGVSNSARPGTESWSFPWVLHRRGVPCVIASKWPLLDLAMLLFFGIFYEADDALRSPAAALRAARGSLRKMTGSDARARIVDVPDISPADLHRLLRQLELLEAKYGREAPFAAPFFWAPMALSGRATALASIVIS